jgi:hypothetical protein
MIGTPNIYRPHGFLSQYKYSGVTGDIGAGAGADSEIFQFRNPDITGKLILIHKIEFNGMRASTAFAVGAIDIKTTIARGWTANGTGGTALSFASNTNKMRTALADSIAVGRIATTAALGAGTKNLDAQNSGNIITHSSAGVGAATPIIGSIYLPKTTLFEADSQKGESPIILAQDEGIVIRATVPATGVWNAGIAITWTEVRDF